MGSISRHDDRRSNAIPALHGLGENRHDRRQRRVEVGSRLHIRERTRMQDHRHPGPARLRSVAGMVTKSIAYGRRDDVGLHWCVSAGQGRLARRKIGDHTSRFLRSVGKEIPKGEGAARCPLCGGRENFDRRWIILGDRFGAASGRTLLRAGRRGKDRCLHGIPRHRLDRAEFSPSLHYLT